jgi:hypothetical protein
LIVISTPCWRAAGSRPSPAQLDAIFGDSAGQPDCPPVSPDGGLAGTASPVAELSEIFTKLNYSLIGNSSVHS